MNISPPDPELVMLTLAAVMLCHAALHDLIARTIPNTDCVLLGLLGMLDRLLHRQLLLSCGLALMMLVTCHALWSRRLLGGGDVKLIVACCCLVAPMQIPGLIGGIICAGGVLAAVYLCARSQVRSRPQINNYQIDSGAFRRLLRRENWRLRRGAGLPYGVAISAAALLTLWRT